MSVTGPVGWDVMRLSSEIQSIQFLSDTGETSTNEKL